MIHATAPIILASGSTIRQQMLKACGLHFSVEVSGVDEETLAARHAGASTGQQALALGRAKALAVSARHPQAYVIGADQMCSLGDAVYQKPGSYSRAEAQLAELAGKAHTQHSGVALAHGGEIIWEYIGEATLTMRDLTAAEIRAYIEADAPLQSCGAYKFEGLGRHLFHEVLGDHDVIQGLPLLPLLNALHARGVLRIGAAA